MKRKKNNAIIVSSTSESEIDAKDENLKKRINKNSLKNSIRNKKLKTSKKKFLVSQELTFVDSDDDVIESADYNLPITGTSDITSSPLEQSNSHLSSIQQPSNNLKKALFSNFQKKVFRNEESHLKKNSTKSTLFPKVDSKLAHSNELWIDLFQPQVASELAVHSKKIQEVRNWILNSFNTMDKILLMTGPSGCGKTATIKALQNELAFEIVEWENPIEENKFINKESRDQEFSVTLTKKFEEFIASSLKFSALSFVNTENIENAADIKKLQKVSNKVILIEDIPNIHNKLVRLNIHNILRRFILSKNANKPTLILIVSNSRENDEEESYKSKRNSNGSFRNIIPHEFILSKKVSTINFNLIAPTILIKPLKKITERFTYSSGKRSPSVADIEAVAFSSGGDVRCAINSLQFLFSDKDFDSEDVKVKKKKKKNLAKDF
ncbi:Cell cycle checkpoint protein rad17 [Clydaea vesicula]|uniref:Cell cycle checkpoint protein rad17 n=1 Tax=Clydaea vesicula TaxID=447962 RepID=A0AAD5U4L9_9FUNG|nr:Cell cycle checkpoint protein rad17 [Clydaea vesicula]